MKGRQFKKTHFSATGRYWLGREEALRQPFLGIPVSNSMIDYIEYYWLTEAQYDEFMVDDNAAAFFAEACRRREHDDVIVFAPGSDRGAAR
ncbi:MAG: hypothetical protein PGN37_11295 [Mycobacterium kyogaense]|uniref:hypothetical protein n=1 Tax=Mycobacterium kyogaense TaxID=2212479 RepID=UPI002FFB443B